MSDKKKDAEPTNVLQEAPGTIRPAEEPGESFPPEELYFRVFESEEDEPTARVKKGVLKLYERWEAENGRRWPKNGMNTEDLVWVEEELRKEKKQAKRRSALAGGKAGGAGPSSGGIPGDIPPGLEVAEKAQFTDEFIPESKDSVASAMRATGLPGDKDLTYSVTAAGQGAWVTDEVESQEYEAGNLETLFNMYLWDGNGEPLIMPPGEPKLQEGEATEEWQVRGQRGNQPCSADILGVTTRCTLKGRCARSRGVWHQQQPWSTTSRRPCSCCNPALRMVRRLPRPLRPGADTADTD